ncbi:MAG TPA: hypothetical protein VFW63_07995, partial [Acidimicrobiales bacterium]|nr:hypothetical protein [Acidimicrobiales bacterium]
TVGDLADLPESAVVAALGPAAGRHLRSLARGVDPGRVRPDRRARSIGHEETFATDLRGEAELGHAAVHMAHAVAGRLRRERRAARTVTLKVRFADFRTVSRSATLPRPVDDGSALAAAARDLLRGIDLRGGVRLLGVTGSGLGDAGVRQLSLDDALAGDRHELGGAVDAIRARFGDAAIGPASSVALRGWGAGTGSGAGRWGPDAGTADGP